MPKPWPSPAARRRALVCSALAAACSFLRPAPVFIRYNDPDLDAPGFSLPWWLFALIPLLLALAYLTLAVVLVHQAEVVLIERLGRFHRQLEPGLHFVVPVLYSVRFRGSMREQVLDIPPQGCITSDNAPLKADAVVYWRIADAYKYVYELQSAVLAIQNLILTQLRSEIGNLTLDETFSARAQLNQRLLKESNEATAPWGIAITRVEVRDIVPNSEILQAMELQMAAERKKRALVIQSEGQKLALLNDASGKAEALKIESESQKLAKIVAAEAEQERLTLEARGAAAALRVFVGAVDGDVQQAVRVQVLRSYIEAQAALATSPNAKVLSFPSMEELLAKGGSLLSELRPGAVPASGGVNV